MVSLVDYRKEVKQMKTYIYFIIAVLYIVLGLIEQN
jgi:hypothetical protein